MDRIELPGELTAVDSFAISARLGQLTSMMRPAVTVDLSDTTEVHPSVVSILIRHRRQARRQGGDLRVIRPGAGEARHTIEQIGLVNPPENRS